MTMAEFFVHESSVVDDGVQIGAGTKIWHFCHIQSGAVIGENCSFGQNVNVSNHVHVGNGVKVQNNVSLYEGVELEDYVFCGPSMVFTNDLTPRARYPKGHAGYKRTLVCHDATIGANALGMKPLMFAGTEEQRRHFADIVTGGGFSAFALTEPNAGSDAGAMATTAKAVGNDYVLNGRKCFCTNAQYAEIFTIFASVDRSQGVKGITAFLVDRDTPGLSIGKHEDKLGQRTSVTNDVVLEDVVIPAKNRIGEEGKGFALAMRTLDRGRAGAAATAVGLARAVLEQSVVYAQQRKSMGKQIIDHQAIQFMLADMATQIEASRQLAWYAARLIDAGHPSAGKVGAMAKCLATDTAVKAATDGIQIMGGYGYSREYPMEKLYRDAKIFQIFEGTNQIQRMVIGGALKKEYKI